MSCAKVTFTSDIFAGSMVKVFSAVPEQAPMPVTTTLFCLSLSTQLRGRQRLHFRVAFSRLMGVYFLEAFPYIVRKKCIKSGTSKTAPFEPFLCVDYSFLYNYIIFIRIKTIKIFFSSFPKHIYFLAHELTAHVVPRLIRSNFRHLLEI